MMLEPATVPDGCYLVRESKNRVGQFSIDVKFNFLVKHIKVVYSDGTYCLAPSKTFNSIVELVTHYQHSTLGQVFRDLQTKLLVPYRCLPGSWDGSLQDCLVTWSDQLAEVLLPGRSCHFRDENLLRGLEIQLGPLPTAVWLNTGPGRRLKWLRIMVWPIQTIRGYIGY